MRAIRRSIPPAARLLRRVASGPVAVLLLGAGGPGLAHAAPAVAVAPVVVAPATPAVVAPPTVAAPVAAALVAAPVAAAPIAAAQTRILTRKEFIWARPELNRRYRAARGMAVGGAVAMIVGGLATLPALTFLVLRPSKGDYHGGGFEPLPVPQGHQVAAIVGAIGFVAGVTTLTIGSARRRSLLSEVDAARLRPRIVAAPWMARGSGGVTARVSF